MISFNKVDHNSTENNTPQRKIFQHFAKVTYWDGLWLQSLRDSHSSGLPIETTNIDMQHGKSILMGVDAAFICQI